MKNYEFTYKGDFHRGSGGVILTTEDPKNRFDCCKVMGSNPSDYDAMIPRPSYAKCEFHGWIPGTVHTARTIRKGGLHFKEIPYTNRPERLVRMDFNELIPYRNNSKLDTSVTIQLNKVKIEVYDNMSWNKPHCPNLAGSV